MLDSYVLALEICLYSREKPVGAFSAIAAGKARGRMAIAILERNERPIVCRGSAGRIVKDESHWTMEHRKQPQVFERDDGYTTFLF